MTAEATNSTGAAGAREGDSAIVCSDLVRIFASDGVEVQALQGLNLRVERGEMVAIVGASGSGKSTLLGILSGLDRQTAGTASVAGRNLLTLSRAQRVDYRRHTVGFVWQQTGRNLLPYLTAAENVAMARSVAGTSRNAGTADAPGSAGTVAAARLDVDALLELLEVGHCADRTPARLSGGEQQRVAIAVALANQPAVLLADEPTGELDDKTSADVLEAMRGVNRELGVTTLIVTHDPTVSEHVRRTVQIRDGRTSTEVLRRTEQHESGAQRTVAEEFAVIDRVGRLQLPQEYLTSLQLHDRVRLALEPDHVGVWPGQTRLTPTGPDGRAVPGESAEPESPEPGPESHEPESPEQDSEAEPIAGEPHHE
ncbi:ABC transporter ATP-binding protein [Rathayibacter soli]|uniref:ABC transporter ATP-binding protein n=1 Tax=Rathayibacter soli TaxID=3144168 RepID=UPI0027E51CC9|nr:ABC transporter ATP-binding protein [Glaciibacter superstes]